MYVSECWAYEPIQVEVGPVNSQVGLVIEQAAVGGDRLSITLSNEQLRQVRDEIDRYLEKKATAAEGKSATA